EGCLRRLCFSGLRGVAAPQGALIMARAYLSLGSNLGDSRAYLQQAVAAMEENADFLLLAKSSLYRSSPWGKKGQADFLNAAVIVESPLAPLELLAFCQNLEEQAGRQRLEHWGSRTLDVDIIAIEGVCSTEQPLLLPHPYYQERLFVLAPLFEIAGDLALAPGFPGLAALLESCRAKDKKEEQRIEVIAGPNAW
ncbi:MAG: 2-amino-4-hydroxy-6-hydroxymethyldihydropteridine diphosphokinase, partial [Bacillota bacterium]|nr:2-amino-4-hydroxy-6-hydroxymethyldihydropteridine diphosphokinase [Bacillota bacterium]